ncbi:Isotrichodermin C-15 hydroxylase [Neolecta irregularis DAH-3]|uniref:Isotrichodermin C-15 hydroxylase n=1 Tax=Neolecta irregularis (strain DAH-3) TaxID=1198029 RepID=A0A1U7LPC1_NEOID|nr:Isotrichodermin C-15 hydroxylase [Neolecta irregularis DAH-3]|eukprot:OLL24371.1 Isotrichodermin C-15 hydroxylase [Neolecta irregularis DAH-3]
MSHPFDFTTALHLFEEWSLAHLVFGPILFYFVTLCVYRIFFHPLAKFPGPFLSKITPLYHTYLTIRGDRHLVLEKYHKKYGDIFRMGPNELSIADASAIKEIYGHGKRLLKPAFYDAMNTPAHQYNIFSERNIAKNSRKRRIISSVMAAKNMVQMEWVMIEKTDLLCEKMRREIKAEGGSKIYDISSYLDFLTFDIMGVLCFGKSFQMIENDGACEVPVLDAIHAVGRSGLIFGSYPFALKFRDWLEPKKYIVDRYNFVMFSLKNLEERLTREIEGKKDFLSFLVRAVDPESSQSHCHRR